VAGGNATGRRPLASYFIASLQVSLASVKGDGSEDLIYRIPFGQGTVDRADAIIGQERQHRLTARKTPCTQRQRRVHQIQRIGVPVAKHVLHFVHHGCQQIDAIRRGTVVAGRQVAWTQHVGELEIIRGG